MEIVFEETNYPLESLNDLQRSYPEASKLIHFIKSWIHGNSSFEFQTSGSTGIPKTITINKDQIIASVHGTTSFLGLEKNHKALICLDPNFIASLMMAARCLINDMDLLLKRPSSNPLQSVEEPIDFASFVPIQIYKMIEGGTIDQLVEIKNILIGGAPLTQSAFNRLTEINTNIFVTYGMTETVSHIALMPVKGNYSEALFKVLPGIQIGQDEEGCLHIVGQVTQEQVIQTNDIVEIYNSDKFRWLGRRDHVINSGGIKIHPEQLEKSIETLINSDFIISWKSDLQLGSECIIITEGQRLSNDQLNEIEKAIAMDFSKYHIPKQCIEIDAFERTDSGKVKREETRKKALGLL